MHSIRIQLLAFITAVLLIFLVILNIYPITSSRDLIFEEKKSALSGQASVVASSLSGLDRLAPESVREVLQLLDLGGYSRTVVAGADGTVLYERQGKEVLGKTKVSKFSLKQPKPKPFTPSGIWVRLLPEMSVSSLFLMTALHPSRESYH